MVVFSILFRPQALEDLSFWISQDRNMAIKVMKLINAISKSPYEGIGKPELLKHDLSGSWSRRVDQQHRIVYDVVDNQVIILQCRFHYG